MRGLLYIDYIYTESTVKFTVQLFIGLAISNTASIKGIINCAGPLRAILTVPII